MHEYGRMRRRDGAYQWAIFRDTEVADLLEYLGGHPKSLKLFKTRRNDTVADPARKLPIEGSRTSTWSKSCVAASSHTRSKRTTANAVPL